VHGLLGQRAISPAPMQAPIELDPLGGDGIAPSELSMLASQSALSAAPTMGGGGGVGAGTTIHAVVQPDGEQRSHWTQGEGAIVGSYRDYQATPTPHAHVHARVHAHVVGSYRDYQATPTPHAHVHARVHAHVHVHGHGYVCTCAPLRRKR